MLVVTVRIKVVREKQLEFEQTIKDLIEEFENSGECLGWHFLKEMFDERTYCIETRWERKAAMEKFLKSKRFKILSGAIQNLCDPPNGKLSIARTLEENII